ncbi:transglutaminase-like cysteine peptidase [Pleomorphomonas sp. NRK KF1]|uniref:transglutaminase-like cysteine peptidase n=1 Tax=Pleomorphomonas sp. NRK KF1 TaxID=2943000 RepID=UPI0020441FD0|nr:transglutaminase-like cysteine peptidase [Pleomorphomonas sp. NRK KF1]MCM5555407.1 transglutaminase-like cysteine peptidase [Pleomorphomonas sp. NRK KF1]
MSAVSALIAGVMAAYTIGPAGFYRMCLDSPSDCRPVVQTRVLSVEEVQDVNRIVNASIHPKAESPGKDDWRMGPKDGDCEDYAITKRRLLIARGVGSANARIAVAEFKGGDHAILLVTLSGQTYVLDNLTDAVQPAEQSTMRFTSIQSAKNPRMWLRPK